MAYGSIRHRAGARFLLHLVKNEIDQLGPIYFSSTLSKSTKAEQRVFQALCGNIQPEKAVRSIL